MAQKFAIDLISSIPGDSAGGFCIPYNLSPTNKGVGAGNLNFITPGSSNQTVTLVEEKTFLFYQILISKVVISHSK